MIRVSITLADATVTETETLTAGRVGLECAFTFSGEWDGLQKVAVFEGAETIEVALGTATVAVVPPECMATAGYNLRVGAYGLSTEEAVVIPTVWAKAGKIKDSASPDETSLSFATPELAAQVMAEAESALEIAQAVSAAADNGDFNGTDGADGVSPTVTVTTITGGHNVEITDANGTTDFDVMDGLTPEIFATATTLPAGSSATANITGTVEQPLVTFGIPKGDKGDTGNTGPSGAMTVGTVTTLAAGADATVTNSGTSTAAVLNFGIPKGAKGETGDKGEPGDPSPVLDWSAITAVKGVINSATADTDTNTLDAIASSNTRCVAGPFKLQKSVIMTPDSSVKFKLYKRFSTDDTTSFRDMWGSWATTKHIEGSNPKAYELCNYYIQAAYSGDTAITDPYDVLSHITIEYTNSNPLGLIETVGTVAYSTVPNGVGNSNSVLRLESYKQYSDHPIAYYCKNTNARIGVWSSDDVYSDSLTGAPLKYGCTVAAGGKESIVLLQNYTGEVNTSIQMKDYSSFEALYAAWGLNMDVIDVDTRSIQGSTIYDYIAGLSAANNGSARLSEMFSSGVMLNDGGQILYGHVPCVKVDGNTAYVVMQCDRTNNYENSATTEIDVVVVDLTNFTQRYTVIGKSGGTYGGVTFNGRCSNPQCYLVGTTLHVVFVGGVSSEQTLVHCAYNTTNDSFTNTVATFTDNGTTSNLNATNFNRYIGAMYGVPNVSSEIIVSAFRPYNGSYLSAFTSYDGVCIRRTPIVYTTDFTDFKLLHVLDIEYGSHCETAMYVKDSTLFLAARHMTEDSTIKIMKFNLTTEKIVDTLQIPASASRPAFYEQNGSVVLLNSVRSRMGMQMIQVTATVLSTGNMWSEMYDNRILSYPSVDLWGDKLVWALQTRRNGNNTDSVTKIWLGITSKI